MMFLFDFHHHHPEKRYGIYNLDIEAPFLPKKKFSVGIHPKNINEHWQENFEKLKEISHHENCIAIGECGIDGLISIDETLQKKVFEAQILWANKIHKPLIIHCVKRFQELIPYQKLAKVPLIIHGFNKKKSLADEMLKHGFYLSFGKSVLHNLSLQAIIKDFPLEKMFLETDDAHFDMAELYLKVAEIKGISMRKLQEQISKNFESINIKF